MSEFQDPARREQLRHQVGDKLKSLVRRARSSEPVRLVVDRVRTLNDMVWDREYDIAWTTRLSIFAALAYFVMPADAIPDFIPVLGFADDAAVLGLVIRQVSGELTRYREFRSNDVQVEAVRVDELHS